MVRYSSHGLPESISSKTLIVSSEIWRHGLLRFRLIYQQLRQVFGRDPGQRILSKQHVAGLVIDLPEECSLIDAQ